MVVVHRDAIPANWSHDIRAPMNGLRWRLGPAAVGAGPVDAVAMDRQMPEVDGFAAVGHCRAQEEASGQEAALRHRLLVFQLTVVTGRFLAAPRMRLANRPGPLRGPNCGSLARNLRNGVAATLKAPTSR